MQYELKKCQDQMGLKNDHKDDKTRNVKRKDEYTKIGFREVGPDTTESTSDTTVSEANSKGHE